MTPTNPQGGQMEVRSDDVVYLIAVRTRGANRGRAVQEVLKVSSLARADEDTEYSAHVVAKRLDEAYSVGGPLTVQNLNDVLRAAGFDFDSANMVVPVATGYRRKGPGAQLDRRKVKDD